MFLFIFCESIIAEFTEEKDRNDSTAVSIITNKWLSYSVDNDGNITAFYWWSTVYKNDKSRTQAIIKHEVIDHEKC